MFENRTYRRYHEKAGLISFDITVKETNLNIQADTDLSDLAIKAVLEIRGTLEAFIEQHPRFATSLLPIPDAGPAPVAVTAMLDAGQLAGVGPMAAVAGTVAHYTGKRLLEHSSEVIVENGGDIFIQSNSDTTFSIYAGDSPFSMKTGIKIKKRASYYGLCTSSGTLGHSKSFGKADAVCVFSESCPLADAMATSLGNRVVDESDIQPAIDFGKSIAGILGIVIVKDDKIGAWGDLELVTL